VRGVPLRCPYHYTHKKNKFISNISCLQTYYTRKYMKEKRVFIVPDIKVLLPVVLLFGKIICISKANVKN